MPSSQLGAFRVPCMTLDEVIKKYGFKEVHLLVIDTEGLDQQVLASLTLSRTQPLVIQFEHGHLSPTQIELAVSYLRRHDYAVLYGGIQTDTIAIRNVFLERLVNAPAGSLANR